MTVEAILTRALEITFIDARKLAMEAKLEQNIVGYPSADQQEELVSRAIEIFQSKPERDQIVMKQMNKGLEHCKIKNGSVSSRDNASNHSRTSLNDSNHDKPGSNNNNGEYKSYMRRAGSNDDLNQGGSTHSQTRKIRNRLGGLTRNGSGSKLFSMKDGMMKRIASSGSTGYLRRLGNRNKNSTSNGSSESLKTMDDMAINRAIERRRKTKKIDIDELVLKYKSQMATNSSNNKQNDVVKVVSSPTSSMANTNTNDASNNPAAGEDSSSSTITDPTTTSVSANANFTWDNPAASGSSNAMDGTATKKTFRL